MSSFRTAVLQATLPPARWTGMIVPLSGRTTMDNLKGKRVLVTAGAGGIGLVTARSFLAAGAKVFICDVDQDTLDAFTKGNPAAGATLADVSDEKTVDRLFAEAGKFLGGLDILINNAGIAGPT